MLKTTISALPLAAVQLRRRPEHMSTPEVRLPLFSVTRFTAKALPLNEQVSSRCKLTF